MRNFNSIGSEVSEPQVPGNRYLPLTGGIALTTLTCYTVLKVELGPTFVLMLFLANSMHQIVFRLWFQLHCTVISQTP